VCALYVAAYLVSGDKKWIDWPLIGEKEAHLVDLRKLEEIIAPVCQSDYFWKLMNEEILRKEGPRTQMVLSRQVIKVLENAIKAIKAPISEEIPMF